MSTNQQVLVGTAAITVPPQVTFTTSGTWVCPAGVTSVSVVAIGVGGVLTNPGVSYYPAAGGGALAYTNNITVTPGNSYTITINTTSSTFDSGGAASPSAGAGANAVGTSSAGGAGGTVIAGTGGAGGAGGPDLYSGSQGAGGGGGAGGYSGVGGLGSATNAGFGGGPAATAGSGGGGGGGQQGSGGGGVDVLGQAADGAVTIGGSTGLNYGGGSALNGSMSSGAVRIIWPGNARLFPSTRTANE